MKRSCIQQSSKLVAELVGSRETVPAGTVVAFLGYEVKPRAGQERPLPWLGLLAATTSPAQRRRRQRSRDPAEREGRRPESGETLEISVADRRLHNLTRRRGHLAPSRFWRATLAFGERGRREKMFPQRLLIRG